MDSQFDEDGFVDMLTRGQLRLRAYIAACIGNTVYVDDILQEVNSVVWQKRHTLKSLEGFFPWAFSIARYGVLAYLRNQKRDRLVFSPEVAELVSQAAEQRLSTFSERQDALRLCLGKVGSEHLLLLKRKYCDGWSIAKISQTTGKSTDSVRGVLKRLRKGLGECISRRLAASN